MKTSTLKSISIIAGAALGAALVGLLGTYLVLPEVAPSVAAETEEATPDSTSNQASQPDTSRSAATADQSAPETGASTSSETAPPETRDADQGRSETAEPDESSAPTDTARPDTTEAAVAQPLRDSLRTLRRRLRQKKEEARTLQTETDSLRKKLAAADAERAKVNELSDALMDMRRRGLTNLLKEVNMSVLKKLYQQTSGTARTRLLRSMDPPRAAQFVNQVVEDGTTEPSPISEIAPDSTLSSE